MAKQKQPSEITLLRRELEHQIELLVDEMVQRRRNPTYSRSKLPTITVFASDLGVLDELLRLVTRKQQAGSTHVDRYVADEFRLLLRKSFTRPQIPEKLLSMLPAA